MGYGMRRKSRDGREDRMRGRSEAGRGLEVITDEDANP